MKMRMHLHLESDVTVAAVDYLDTAGRPIVAAMIRGGAVHMKDGGAEINMPIDVIQLYMDPVSAFEFASAIIASIPLDVPVTRCMELVG